MSWQDLVLAAGGFVIAAGVVPAVLAPAKPPIVTSLILVAVLGVSTVAFASLGLWLTAAGTTLQCVLWSVILEQSLIARRVSRPAGAAALTTPVVTVPDLGFEAYQPDEVVLAVVDPERIAAG